MATKGSKPIIVRKDTPPDELPEELRGTIFDSSHVERGAHLRKDEELDNTIEGQLARIKEGSDMATKAPAKPASKATKTNGKAPATKGANKVSAAPAEPFDRVAASAQWAAQSPCEAATGPKRDPRPCKGVGVVERETITGKRIKVCAAHVLATEVATVAERQKLAADKEAAKAAKATPAAKPAKAPATKAAPAAKATKAPATPAKATPAPKPGKKAAAAK